ncbi:hypothetical protein [Streptomyces iconiensis]|uniref:Uncharacterized protein n=1 Tax=Streptomyces iconiensis TaxID=1384038 RepID=A0ABT6ZYB0_9ACTN|nr:hypothetical protein [Streptomyces iconiensis]MDJ1134058.1 hypothetical protein [Streptomyces iconiensis]
MTTHNGRGQDGISGTPGDPQLPAATTPREGVVLPAHGDPWTPEQQQQVQAAQAQVQPPSGQPWGQPWGPGAAPGPVQGEQGPGATDGGQGAGVPGGPGHGGPDTAHPVAPGQPPAASQPLPPEGAPAPPPPPPAHAPMVPGAGHVLPQPGTDGYGHSRPGTDGYGHSRPGTDGYGQPLPGTGGYGQSFSAQSPPPQSPPQSQQPGIGGPPPSQPLPGGPGPGGQLPPGTDGYGQPLPGAGGYGQSFSAQPQPGADAAYGQPAHGTQGRHAFPPAGAHAPVPPAVPPAAPPPPTLPPEQPRPLDSESTQMLPPITGEGPQHIGMAMDAGRGHGQGPGQGQPGSEDGTQLLPPQPPAPAAGADSEATQYIAPVPGDSEATQYMAPVTGEAEATLLRTPLPSEGDAGGGTGAHGQGAPGQGAPGQGAPGQGATGPGTPPPGERQPLPEFENLFRAEPSSRDEPDDSPGSTQSLPVFNQAAAQQHERQQQPGFTGAQGFDQYEPQGRAARRGAERARSRRRVPPGLLIGAGLAGVAVIGVLVGIGLSGGDDTSPTANKKDASTAPAGHEESSPPASDPAEEQAKKLDALLADSNNSRSAVVSSVERIKSCKMLGKAATDLRAAARQRTGLVKRLGELKTDKIPNSASLNSALAQAWKSSASADNHYAGWADQTAKKHGCHKGKARGTGKAVAGNRASGAATAAKKKAAQLWNPTAQKYSLTKRQFSEL